jgi:hypothetical protein
VYQKRPAAYKPSGSVSAAVADGTGDVLERRDFSSGARMPRKKKSIKGRSKEKRRALKRRRIRRRKSLRRGKRGP